MSGMLPQDLVVQFLSMLPVISLLRFRCLCKAWCELIDNPSFIAKHFNHSTFNKNECILLKRFIEQRSKNVLSFVSEETLEVISTDIDVPFFYHQYVQLLGTCKVTLLYVTLLQENSRHFLLLSMTIYQVWCKANWVCDLASMKNAMTTRLSGSLTSIIIVPMVVLAIL